MKTEVRILLNEKGDTRLGNFLGVFGIFIITIILIFSNTNAISTGLAVGKIPPNINSYSHSFGNSSGDWDLFNLYSYFDTNWSGNHSEGQFIIIEFLDTDCPHCWDDAPTMSGIHSELESYGLGERVQLFAVATQLPIPTHETSREEIVAFQEKTNFEGCKGGYYNCMDREGDAHQFPYIDDLEGDILTGWSLPGTPYYVILSPNGIIVWHSQSATQGETPGSAIAELLCRDGGSVTLCGE